MSKKFFNCGKVRFQVLNTGLVGEDGTILRGTGWSMIASIDGKVVAWCTSVVTRYNNPFTAVETFLDYMLCKELVERYGWFVPDDSRKLIVFDNDGSQGVFGGYLIKEV